MLTEQEIILLDKTADLYNDFTALEEQHPLDLSEFVAHLHVLQQLIMIRSTRRMHPDLMTNTEVE